MRFGADDDFFGLSFDELFTDREEQQARWKELLSAKAGEPLPVQFYYGVSGEGKTYLRRQFKKLSADKAGIPTLVLDLERMGYGKEGPDRAALVLRLVSEIQMAAPRVQLAALFIAMEEAKSLVDGRALAEDLAVNAVSAGADAFMQSLQGKFESIGIGSFLGAIAKAGWQTYQKSKEPLQAYLRTPEGKADLARLRAMEFPEEIKRTMFKRFGRDLQDHEQPMTGNRAAKAVLLVDTLEADSVGSIRPTEAKNHTWIGDLYAACNEAKDGSQPRLLIAAFGRSRVSHDIPDDHCEEELLGGIPEADAREYLINRRKVSAELVPSMIEEARIGSTPLCHAFSLGLLGDSYALENDLPAVEDDWKHLSKAEALAQRFLKQIREGETGDAGYLARLALTPVWDREAAAFAFGVAEDPEKAKDKLDWLMSFSFVQPAKFPQTEIPGFTLHSIMRRALTETSRDEDTKRRHQEWIDFWKSRSRSYLDTFDRAAWWHKFILEPEPTCLAWIEATESARAKVRMADHLALVLMAKSWLTSQPAKGNDTSRQIWLVWQMSWANEAQQASLGDILALASESRSRYKSAIENYAHEISPELRAAIENSLGSVTQLLGKRSGSEELLVESELAFRAALEVRTRKSFPLEWAETQTNLGNVLFTMAEIFHSDYKLLEAESAFRSALEVFTKEQTPVQWALTKNNLGNSLFRLGHQYGYINELEESQAAYRSALEIRTEASYPAEWAESQSNLGNALLYLGVTNDNMEQILESKTAFESALRVRKKETFPLEWAETQNNVGNVLLLIGEQTASEEMLIESIAAYSKALEVFKQEFYPLNWAMAQKNLGLALSYLGEKREDDEILIKARAAFRAALRVYTEDTFPNEWTSTEESLVYVLWLLNGRHSEDE